ncbi:Conserved hypothetical protein [Geotrichum candidum]|uniref:Uncharacterized protein n=1 Tax=Geotrichum candidum TaxID=1173061 RepID=A0A0J9X8L7_GEOCN|nr:Conserved hypothetical protein [Geotrichum candidum]
MTVYPKVSIEFCTACKWNLRTSWYLQELLSTFGMDLGEVALIPRTGGIFTVTVQKAEDEKEVLIWDRKREGGFPDSKELKRLVRDVIKPGQNLGHVDRIKAVEGLVSEKKETEEVESAEACPNIN